MKLKTTPGNNCNGDVRLDRDERGYEYWGLVPHVSFRDGEDMQPLTGHRQSGGVSHVSRHADVLLLHHVVLTFNQGTIVFYDHVSHGLIRDGSCPILAS